MNQASSASGVHGRGRLRAQAISAGIFAVVLAGCTWTVAAPAPAEPLVPTPVVSAGHQEAAASSRVSEPSAGRPPVERTPPPLAAPDTLRWRMGVGVPDGKSPLIYEWTEPRPGWYLNWSVGFTETVWMTDTLGVDPVFHIPPDQDAGMEFAPMLRMKNGELELPVDWLAATAAARPGHTWLIGNEPDVLWQDNSTPEEYATAFHEAVHAIKEADPSARIAFGGLSQITPLRLAYLDRVWDHYAGTYGEPMPVDVWNMHAFVLQEKADGWGVALPPGVTNTGDGMQWSIEDHDNLAIVEQQVRSMRIWMAEHGQQEKPLWVTEYGILMPAEYGFDEERVRRYLLSSIDLFNNLRDPALGYAADDDRLVQRWVWFSAGYDLYPTGDLFTPGGQPTGLMRALSAYLAEFGRE